MQMGSTAPLHGPSSRIVNAVLDLYRIMLWNVNGLKPEKLKPHEIATLIAAADIIILTETWLVGPEAVPQELQNDFDCFGIYREKVCASGRLSGGVLVCVRKHLSDCVSIHLTDEQAGIIWLKIDGRGAWPDLYMAACYFSPRMQRIGDETV